MVSMSADLRKQLDRHAAGAAQVSLTAVLRILETMPEPLPAYPSATYDEGYADALADISRRVNDLQDVIAQEYQHAE